MFDNTNKDQKLKNLFNQFYGYLNVDLNIYNLDCPVCKPEPCLTISSICNYNSKFEKTYNSLLSNLKYWLRKHKDNLEPIEWLELKAMENYESLTETWLTEKKIEELFPYEIITDTRTTTAFDETGELVEFEEKYEYYVDEDSYNFQFSYYSYIEKSKRNHNTILFTISEAVKKQKSKYASLGYKTVLNNCKEYHFKPAYDTLNDNGYIVKGSLNDFYRAFTNRPIINKIYWKKNGKPSLKYLIDTLTITSDKIILDRSFNKMAASIFDIDGQNMTDTSMQGVKSNKDFPKVDKAATQIKDIRTIK